MEQLSSSRRRMRRTQGLNGAPGVYAYIVMPEHIHLLVSEPQRGTLADALKSLKQSVSRRLIADDHFRRRHCYDFNRPQPGAPFKPPFGLNGVVRPLGPKFRSSRKRERAIARAPNSTF